jgi:enamine deaminase RidA (YjgF/YER057c/UK114 family)
MESVMKQVIQPEDVFDPDAVFGGKAYRQAIRVGDTVYIAGQAAIDVDGKVVGKGDVEAQAVQVMENLVACLDAAGATVNDIVKLTTFYLDRDHRATIANVRSRFLGQAEFVHTGLIIDGLADPELLLEIEAVAVIGSGTPDPRD